ncbi:hypothetical protein BH20ACI3_BH20ACI3_04010 [soil metagenome]
MFAWSRFFPSIWTGFANLPGSGALALDHDQVHPISTDRSDLSAKDDPRSNTNHHEMRSKMTE